MARCTLNNMIMRNVRKTQAYQTVLVDLVKLGVVDKDDAEKVLGYTIPSYIVLPDNSSKVVSKTAAAVTADEEE